MAAWCTLRWPVAALLLQFVALWEASANYKPNVLFIVVDDLSRQIQHLKINPFAVPTPNFDKLAAKGVSFSNAHACAPACNPSRTSFLYGLSPLQTQVLTNEDEADNPSILTKEHLVAYFKRNGYRTVGAQRVFHSDTAVDEKYDVDIFVNGKGAYAQRFGNNRLADPRLTGTLDFGTIFEPVQQDEDWIASNNLLFEMQKSETQSQPALFTMGVKSCHTPIYVSNDVMKNIDFTPNRPPIPANDYNDIGPLGKQMAAFTEPNALLALAEWPLGTSYIRHYYGCIAMSDLLLGKMMAFVDKSDKDWFVVVTSDQGLHILDKMRMSKFTLWPQITQVPLVLYGKGFTGGKLIDQPVSLVDLYPTFAKLIGSSPKYKLVGKNLQAIAGGKGRKPVVVYSDLGKAVVTRKWHLIVYQKFNFATRKYAVPTGEVELYNRIKDPWALKNLANSKPGVVKRLKNKEM